ncbi:MAG TPA: NUDIX domain-containing protein [Pyrinomonadaceae bacterium]|jgi:ADP-ribose pyrophosphatase YjhB (NUDIX family)
MLLDLVSKTWKVLPKQARTFITRRLQSKFTVSVTGIITNEKGEVLLLDHLLRPHSGWGPPGGFVERGEQPEAALRREIKEETTLDLADVRLIRTRTFKRHIEIIFTAKAVGEARVVSREIRGLQWFAIDSMPGEMSLDLQFAIRKALEPVEL